MINCKIIYIFIKKQTFYLFFITLLPPPILIFYPEEATMRVTKAFQTFASLIPPTATRRAPPAIKRGCLGSSKHTPSPFPLGPGGSLGQHMGFVGKKKSVSDLGYETTLRVYRATNCTGCPLRGQCFHGTGNREIKVNVRSRLYRDKAKELLTSERGLYHRSRRPIEPEAVFGQIKFDGGTAIKRR